VHRNGPTRTKCKMGSCCFWSLTFLESRMTTSPRVEARFTKKLAQNNDRIRTLNVCKSQKVGTKQDKRVLTGHSPASSRTDSDFCSTPSLTQNQSTYLAVRLLINHVLFLWPYNHPQCVTVNGVDSDLLTCASVCDPSCQCRSAG
jgi:hypothetical protein